jgi:hypothetical protein
MPMLNSACGDITDITACFACSAQTTLILSQTVGFRESGKVIIRSVKILKSVYLLEEVKVALIAAFERLVSLFAPKDIRGALEKKKIRKVMIERK